MIQPKLGTRHVMLVAVFKELMLNAVALNAILDVDELLGSLTESLKAFFWGKKGVHPFSILCKCIYIKISVHNLLYYLKFGMKEYHLMLEKQASFQALWGAWQI